MRSFGKNFFKALLVAVFGLLAISLAHYSPFWSLNQTSVDDTYVKKEVQTVKPNEETTRPDYGLVENRYFIGFTGEPSTGDAPLKVCFSNKSILPNPPEDIYTWSWDFGDGNASTASNPTHVFEQPGMYEVTLKAVPSSEFTDSRRDLLSGCTYIYVGNSSATPVVTGSGEPWAVTRRDASFQGYRYAAIGEDESIVTIESRQFKQEGIFQFFTEYSENIVDVVTCFDKNGNLKWKDNLSGNINGLDCNAGNCFVYGSYPRGGFGKAGKRTDPYIWTFDKFGKPGWRKKIATKECEGINGIFFGKENESLFAFISGDSGPTAFWVVMNGTCMDCSSINVRTIFKSNEQLMYAIVSIETENGFQKKNKIFVRPVHSNGSSPWKWSYDMSEKESFWEDRYPLNTNGQWAIGNNNVFLAGYIQSRKESIPPWNSVEQLICFNIDLNGKMLWKASFDMGGLEEVNKAVALPDGTFSVLCNVYKGYGFKNESWLLRIDANGREIDRRTFREHPGWVFNGFSMLPDGGMYLYGNSEEGDLLVRTGPNGELPENVRLLGSYKETQEENISVAGENFRTFFGYGYKTISQEEVEKRRNEFADGSLTTLDLKQKCISSLDGIDYFKKLKVLKLPNNSINDISPLAALDDLEALDLSGNCIVDVSPLSGLKKLKVLNLAGNFIEDVSSLASLTGLQELYLYNNKIKDLSVLNKKLDVKILDCANNPGYGLP